ncbi:helix-turn-helix domain-containing protein [Mesorhizobium sp. J428]|uniref:helix-turn-helix domain-containing protein n=1 Tax=Mesorhizobium sp. J428 TaxID=2898440 RepID=UPI0021519674|nr:helix-turn-helix domain-containing protein [Mesorhizobium sp. J428]MCR5859709.1 helix-turn-helix domain-containing protein [Mesorhizobium sp. J428]
MSEVGKQGAVEKAAYTIDEFCVAFGVGKTLAYEEIADRRLKVRKAGRRTLIRAVDAHAWLDALPEGSVA